MSCAAAYFLFVGNPLATAVIALALALIENVIFDATACWLRFGRRHCGRER